MSKDVRSVAAQIINKVRYEQGYTNKLLQSVSNVNEKDMQLLTNITYGTIKHFEYLEAIANKYVALNKNKRIVRVIILIALYQQLFLTKIPEYAIINAAVENAKKVTNQFAANFVNSALRKMFDDVDNLEELSFEDELSEIALSESMPRWIVAMLSKQYTPNKAKMFFQAAKESSRQFGRVNTLKTTVDNVLEKDGHFIHICNQTIQLKNGNIAYTEVFKNGEISIQNISSQQVAPLLNPQVGELVWDMCAAPGGKATHLAEIMQDTGTIIASDLYEQRVKQIKANVTRLDIKCIQGVTMDVTSSQEINKYDKILLDAPCSGLGVLSQKPEIKYQLTPSKLDEMQQLQRKMLVIAQQALKVGGKMVYSTCTVNRKENERQVQWFIKEYPNMKLVSDRLIFDEVEKGYSGFYLALLEKTS